MNQLMEFHQIYLNKSLDKLKSWLDFGDLDLIFKVIAFLVEYLLNQWMDFFQTCINISLWKA